MTAPGATPPRVDEPPLPRRTRRPLDAVRLLVTVAGLALLLLVAGTAEGTTSGLGRDLAALGASIPAPPLTVLSLGAGGLGLAVLPALVVGLLLRRRPGSAGAVVVAATLAVAAAVLFTEWVLGPGPDELAEAFLPVRPQSGTAPVPGLTAAIVAATTATAVPRPLRRLAWAAVLAAVGVGLLGGITTVAGVGAALLLGRISALVVRLVGGSTAVRPDGAAIAELLARHGVAVTHLRAVPGADPRRYDAVTPEGWLLDVEVLDRDRTGAGWPARAWRRLRTKDQALPREALTLERSVDRWTLLSLATHAAGVRTPRLLMALAAEPDAAVLVREVPDTRPLASLTAEEIDDAVLADLWYEVGELHRHGIAHHALSARSLRVDPDGAVYIHDTERGEVAASAFARRVDLAQALVAVAAVVGVDRAVDSAVAVLGPDRVAEAGPVLQPIALPRETRRALRGRADLLTALRDRLVQRAGAPQREPEPLERFSPRAMISALAVVVAVVLVSAQLPGFDLEAVARAAEWRWVVVAALAAASTYVGAAFALLGFVPARVPLGRTIAAQVALSFVRLVAPTTISALAVNARLLLRAGVPPQLAAASVAASQVATVLVTVPLLLVLGLLTGRAVAAGLAPSETAVAVVATIVVVVVLVALSPAMRPRVTAVWRNFVEQGLARLLDVVARPRRLLVGIAGNLLLTLGFAACLAACIAAAGGSAPFAAVAVVYLTGNTVGTVVPTPGGLGTVEAAMTAGLTAIGVPGATAVTAVLLFRLLTFWLPLLPGWIAWNRLQRAGVL